MVGDITGHQVQPLSTIILISIGFVSKSEVSGVLKRTLFLNGVEEITNKPKISFHQATGI